MTAIEEMAGMDVLCSDKTGTLTLNKLTVDKNLIEVSEGKVVLKSYMLFLHHRFVQRMVFLILILSSGFCQRH